MGNAPLSPHSPNPERPASAKRSPLELEALVLALLTRSNRPISAYDIAARSVAAGAPMVPNQVYRTLARLIEQELVYRVESLSAYMLKQQPFGGCLICDQCHAVQIVSGAERIADLAACARGFGFAAERIIVEMHGYCADCSRDMKGTEPPDDVAQGHGTSPGQYSADHPCAANPKRLAD